MSHFLFLSSDPVTYSSNQPYDFTVDLPHTLDLTGEWGVALLQLTAFPSDTASLLVFCDLCSCSSVNDTSLPVLRRILTRASPLDDNINTAFYLPLNRRRVERVRVYIKDQNLADATFLKKNFVLYVAS